MLKYIALVMASYMSLYSNMNSDTLILKSGLVLILQQNLGFTDVKNVSESVLCAFEIFDLSHCQLWWSRMACWLPCQMGYLPKHQPVQNMSLHSLCFSCVKFLFAFHNNVFDGFCVILNSNSLRVIHLFYGHILANMWLMWKKNISGLFRLLTNCCFC